MVEEISQFIEMDQESLLEKGVASLLREKRRELKLKRCEILSRYEVSSAGELEEKIEKGQASEHPAWEDLISLENIENTITKLDKYSKKLQQTA